jgi:hypothetical protein
MVIFILDSQVIIKILVKIKPKDLKLTFLGIHIKSAILNLIK